MRNSLWVALSLSLVALFVPTLVKADCCPNALGAGWTTCADGTSSGGGCCGVGPCNIFCCNCDGGCRKSSTKDQCYKNCEGQRGVCWSGCDLSCSIAHDCEFCYRACSVALDQCKQGCDQKFPRAVAAAAPSDGSRDSISGLVRFSEVDADRDGYITLAEVQAWLKANPAAASCASEEAFRKADKNGDGRLTLDEVDAAAAAFVKKATAPDAKRTAAAVKIDPYVTKIAATLK